MYYKLHLIIVMSTSSNKLISLNLSTIFDQTLRQHDAERTTPT